MNFILTIRQYMIASGFIICLGISACNMPAREGRTPTLSVTQAYQTVEARLTQSISLTPKITNTAQPTAATPAATAPTTPPTTPAQTPAPVVTTPAAALCDQAGPGVPIDVTIPDDTQMQPGQSFTKTWRLQNTGTCTWSNQYALVWFSGEQLGAPNSIPLSGSVAPGQTIDLSVDMQAPQTTGTYQSNWKLRNPSGVLFGIGPSGGSAFWVRIAVQPSLTTTITPTISLTTTPTITPTVGVHVSGSASLQPGDGFDLDNNTVNSGGEDVGYQETDQGLVLAPLGSTGMMAFGANQPSLSECQNADLSANPIPVSDLVSTYTCYRTNMALPGWMLIKSIDATTSVMEVEINTWSVP